MKAEAYSDPIPAISASLSDRAPDHPRIGDAVLPAAISHFADGLHPPSVGSAAPPAAGVEAVREIAAWAARSTVDAVAKRRSARLRLDSERLGSISLDVFVRGTEVTVGFDASGSAMRALLAQGPALAEELASKGLQLIAFLPVGARGAILRR